MSEMTSVEQQQYVGDSSKAKAKHHCKDCGVYFESARSLEVHLRYHQDNLLTQWGAQAQTEESNNNNSKQGNHNSNGHLGQKQQQQDSVAAAADSSEATSRPPSVDRNAVAQQQQQLPQQQQPPQQGYNYQAAIYGEGYGFMENEPGFILGHHYSPQSEESGSNGPASYRYHPYQHHYKTERTNSVSSTSPRSPLQCDKCGAVYEDAGQLAEHVRSSHPTSPNAYIAQPRYQQLAPSPQHMQPQQPQQQQQQQQGNYDFNAAQPIKTEPMKHQFEFASVKQEQSIKQEPEEQAEILDLDSHKVQTHRFDEEGIRMHPHQDIQMQMHHQQQLQQHHQQQRGPHSVNSMISWHQAQPHEYHQGLAGMGGPLDGVPPLQDQSQFMRGQHMQVDSSRHPGSPIISSTQPMPGHQMSAGLLQQNPKPPPIANQSWKSNEARRPKTYNCSACNKWFTSSGHLKRHYNTTLHKNAVKQSNQPDPANMPISAHHHPGRDANQSSRGNGPTRSPDLTSSGSPPNLMAGPSGEATRGLLHTPTTTSTTTSLYNSNSNHNSSISSNSSTSSSSNGDCTAPQGTLVQQASGVLMPSTMVPIHTPPARSPMGSLHQPPPPQQQMGSPSPQLAQHHHMSMGSPSQLAVQHPMTSPMSPHLNSPSPMGPASAHHHMTSPSPIMVGAPSMASPPPPQSMGGTTMPQQPYPNALPPHVTTTTSLPGLLECINQLTTTGNNEMPSQHQQAQDAMLPGFGTFGNHHRPLPSFTQFNCITGFLVGHNQPQSVNVGGLSPEENFAPQDRNFDSQISSFVAPPRYESLANMVVIQNGTTDAKRYEVQQPVQFQQQQQQQQQQQEQQQQLQQEQQQQQQLQQQQQQPQQWEKNVLEHEANNNLPQPQAKEELNPNIVKREKGKKLKNGSTKEHQVSSTNSTAQNISPDGRHKCIECDKFFNKACYLTQHNKSFHSGDKPFKCNQCGKRFPLEYLHAEHLQKHAGEKPYKCESCPKQFNHKTDLRRHMCLHTGEKPYSCDNCGKGFIRKDHMMKHLETHKKKSNYNNVHLRA